VALQPATLVALVEDGTVVLTPELAAQLTPEAQAALTAAGVVLPEPPLAVGDPAQAGVPPGSVAPPNPAGG
jgi:hypothetical protein